MKVEVIRIRQFRVCLDPFRPISLVKTITSYFMFVSPSNVRINSNMLVTDIPYSQQFLIYFLGQPWHYWCLKCNKIQFWFDIPRLYTYFWRYKTIFYPNGTLYVSLTFFLLKCINLWFTKWPYQLRELVRICQFIADSLHFFNQ